MGSGVFYHFEWEPKKARLNQRKHGVSFRLSTSILRDPLALTIYDEAHSEDEERWVTLGRSENGQFLVVVHTWQWIDSAEVRIRIISARKADQDEIRDYENTPR